MAQLNFSSASSMRAFPERDKTVQASSQDALFTRVDVRGLRKSDRIPISHPEHLLGMFLFYPTPTSQQFL